MDEPKRVLIVGGVGGGFIGLEMAENLARRGLSVTIVEKADQVTPPLGREMAALVESACAPTGSRFVCPTASPGSRRHRPARSLPTPNAARSFTRIS